MSDSLHMKEKPPRLLKGSQGLEQAGHPGVADQLGAFFDRSGYVRRQRPDRIAKEDRTQYKKGYEVRLIVYSEDELTYVRALLVEAGLKPGSLYRQGARQIRQPVYGREQVARFLEMIGASADDARPAVTADARAMPDDYEPSEIDWGPPTGREVW